MANEKKEYSLVIDQLRDILEGMNTVERANFLGKTIEEGQIPLWVVEAAVLGLDVAEAPALEEKQVKGLLKGSIGQYFDRVFSWFYGRHVAQWNYQHLFCHKAFGRIRFYIRAGFILNENADPKSVEPWFVDGLRPARYVRLEPEPQDQGKTFQV